MTTREAWLLAFPVVAVLAAGCAHTKTTDGDPADAWRVCSSRANELSFYPSENKVYDGALQNVAATQHPSFAHWHVEGTVFSQNNEYAPLACDLHGRGDKWYFDKFDWGDPTPARPGFVDRSASASPPG